MSAALEEQGLVAAQLAGLRQHGLTTPAALRLVLPSLRGSLAREAASLLAALERGAVPEPSASPLLGLLARDQEASSESLWEVARGFATAAEAELAWAQVSRPWILGGAGLSLLLCVFGWTYAALPAWESETFKFGATIWTVLGVMRWLGVPLALGWFLAARASWLPMRASITRPFLLAAALHGRAGARGSLRGSGAGAAKGEADALWTATEWRAFQLLRARHGEAVAAGALASELEREGRASAASTAAVSALLCLVCGMILLGALTLPILYTIFTTARAA